MSAKLENYLNERRVDLDTESPDDLSVWNGIRSKLDGNRQPDKIFQKRSRLILIRNIAAAAFIVFSLGYITNDIINGKRQNLNVTLSSIDKELGRRENAYKMVIGFKTEQVSQFANSGDQVINELFSELKKLDTDYTQAMNDLKVIGPDEKIINTIFNTYEQRIRLLELIILEINKNKSHENNEKITL
jgi:hypothetical protein